MVEEAETDLSGQAEEPPGRVVAMVFPSAAVASACPRALLQPARRNPLV